MEGEEISKTMQDHAAKHLDAQDAQQATKRFKQEESGDGVSIPLPKRMSTRELSYIDTDQILPEVDFEAEEEEWKEDKEQEALRVCGQKIGEFFKKSKKYKAIEFEGRVEDMNELNDMNIFMQYKKLKKTSANLNSFIKNKLMLLKESLLQPPVKLKQNLRAKISSSFNKETSEWTLKIEGRVMIEDKELIFEESKNLKMLHFFEKIFIDFDKEDQRSYMNIDWRKLNNSGDWNYDSLEITRSMIPERENINISIKFYKEYCPKEFLLSDKLANLLNIKQGNIMTIVNALWQYIKLNRLQDRDRRKIINWNKELEEIFNKESIEFSRINSLLRQHLRSTDPIEINFQITKGDPEPKMVDIPVEIISNYRSELEDFIVANNITLITEGEINEKTDDSSPFDNEGLSISEKSILKNVGTCLKNSFNAFRFYKEYAINPKLKIQNLMVEQKHYLDVMGRRETDLTDQLENEEEHSQFYTDNKIWLRSEVEDYEEENSLRLLKEQRAVDAQEKEETAKEGLSVADSKP